MESRLFIDELTTQKTRLRCAMQIFTQHLQSKVLSTDNNVAVIYFLK